MLPTRKNPRSTKLTIASIKADYNPEKQWIFPTTVLDKTEIKKVVARVVEIATRDNLVRDLHNPGADFAVIRTA